MTLKFEFIQDFRKYRDYITYITKADEALGKLPFLFYQGDMLDCYVVERLDTVVTVTLSNNTANLVERFVEDAQPDTFEPIPEGIAYIYDIAKHQLIYDFDKKAPTTSFDWSTYPDVFWVKDEDAHDHGLVLGSDGSLCRMYLSNRRLMSLFVGLHDLNSSFPKLSKPKDSKDIIESAGALAVLSILANHLGQDEPKVNDVRTAIACDLLAPTGEYAGYNVDALVRMFELQGNKDDLWEDTWKSVDDAITRDNQYARFDNPGTSSSVPLETYTEHILVSDLAGLNQVPEVDRVTYVHQDIPIHGIHYIMVEPDRNLQIFFDDLIIKEEDIIQHFENLPADQIQLISDYAGADVEIDYGGDYDELDALNKSGITNTNVEVDSDDS